MIKCSIAVYSRFGASSSSSSSAKDFYVLTHYTVPWSEVWPFEEKIPQTCSKIRRHVISLYDSSLLTKMRLALSGNYFIRNKQNDEVKKISGTFNLDQTRNFLHDYQNVDLARLEDFVKSGVASENVDRALYKAYEDSNWLFSGELESITLQFSILLGKSPSLAAKPENSIPRLILHLPQSHGGDRDLRILAGHIVTINIQQ